MNDGLTDWGREVVRLQGLTKKQLITEIVGMGVGASVTHLETCTKARLVAMICRLTDKFDIFGGKKS